MSDAAPERAATPKRDGPRTSDGRPAPTCRRDDDGPVLPETTRDERDVGWGDEPSQRDDDWYRRERPPHHE